MEYPQWATPERRAFLAELAQRRCAKGEAACPVWQRFVQAIVDRIGPPGHNAWAWVMRAALATPKVLADMPLEDSYHISSWVIQELMAFWKAYDREERERLWKREQRRLHAAPQLWKRGEFDSIRREQYLADRPVWRIVSIGLSAFTFKRVAQVEIPGLKKVIFVDLTGIKLEGAKSKKLARYKRGALPKGLVEQVDSRVAQAVARFLQR